MSDRPLNENTLYCGGRELQCLNCVPLGYYPFRAESCRLQRREPAKVDRTQDAAPASVVASPAVSYVAPALMDEYTEPAPSREIGHIAASPDGYAARAVVVENIAPAPTVYCVAHAPVDRYTGLAPALYAAPASAAPSTRR